MLIQTKPRIDNIVFTCAILHNMLIDYDEWSDEDDDYDIGADVGADVMDPRVVDEDLLITAMLAEEICQWKMCKWKASGWHCEKISFNIICIAFARM